MRRLLVIFLLLGAACGDSAPSEVVLMTHDSFDASIEVLAAFEEDTGIAIRVLQAGDAGSMVNQAILTKDNPTADVMYGVDNTFLSRALSEGIFEPYESPLVAQVPAELHAEGVTPIDFGDVCLNYDRAGLTDAGVAVPATLEDLTAPEYAGMVVVENPATSSPGLAFLLATIARFGETGEYTWQDYWRDLRDNDLDVAEGWTDAYYGVFSGGSGEGDRPLVVSYASSPPVEVIFAEEPPEVAPTGVITDGCFRQVEYAGVLAGTDNPDAARRLVDFLLSVEFQEDMPLNMFVFPANADVALPDVFVEHTTLPDSPLSMTPGEIESNRERWIEEWTEIVLR